VPEKRRAILNARHGVIVGKGEALTRIDLMSGRIDQGGKTARSSQGWERRSKLGLHLGRMLGKVKKMFRTRY